MSAIERCPNCGATSPVVQGGSCGGCCYHRGAGALTTQKCYAGCRGECRCYPEEYNGADGADAPEAERQQQPHRRNYRDAMRQRGEAKPAEDFEPPRPEPTEDINS